jgi:asparagine synthase (glutamine-hydrolysing)
MCGITGSLASTAQSVASLETSVCAMSGALLHRGPDDAGVWADGESGIALGHRRLAIQDLSPAGHQPMVSASGRFVIAFNGEIYNHLELRAELNSGQLGASNTINWRGHSDTETLLAGVSAWGLEATLKACVGMFAIALWDRTTHTLSLVRDRLGEKPLYYGWVGQGDQSAFVFASELKALCAYPSFANPINRQSLAQYLRLMYVPAPYSIYQGIYKLEPGCILTVHGLAPGHAPTQPIQPGEQHRNVSIHRWWNLAEVEQQTAKAPVSGTDLLAQLEDALLQAVQDQSLADVPLGAFLSGGVDSSTVVALMQKQARERGDKPVKTFTIGFDEAGFDESPHARAVAQHLGTQHHEMRVTARMAQDVIPNLPWMYDEPFADSSQIPTHLVSRAARQHVTVALSGDAGDELFGGYNRYFWGPRVWNKVAWMPFAARRGLGESIKAFPPAVWDAASHLAGINRLGDKAHKLAARLRTVRNIDDLYWSLIKEWQDDENLVIGASPSDEDLFSPASRIPPGVNLSPEERMMFLDTITYLPDDILCKVDRAAMACSLETRVPFLDHRVVEMAWRLPLHMKIRGNQGKWALRQVLYKYVPKELIERPKAGFGIPVGIWLRGPLREWAEALLNPQRLAAEGYLNAKVITRAWQEHLSGRRDHTAKLWAVLMFQAWLEHHNQALH